MKRGRVAVVGGGLAGLAAARRLAGRGLSVVLLEAASRPGGRAAGASEEGFALEPGGGLVFAADRALLGWIDEVGAGPELLPTRRAEAAQVAGGRIRPLPERGRAPGVGPVAALRLLRLPRLLARYGACLDPAAPERAARIDDRSLADFGRLYFGRSALDYGMAPLATSASLGTAEETSRALFLRRVAQAGDRRPGILRGALGELADAAAKGLDGHLGARVASVHAARRGGLELRVDTGGREHRLRAEAVVLATDAPGVAAIAADVLEPAERGVLARVGSAPGIAVAAALVRPLSPRPRFVRVPHAEGLPLETVVLEPGLRGGRVPDGRGLLTLRATGAWSAARWETRDEQAVQELVGAFERLRPGARSALSFARVLRHPRAAPRFGVGAYRDLARFARVQRDLRARGRRLYFAGDWRTAPGPDGAVASGLRAADEVLEDLA